jgi:hypothetical protein
MSPSPSPEKAKPKGPQVKKVEGPEPWATVATAARAALEPKSRQTLKQKQIPSKFGVGAFVETLCRIVFTYLATYGNNAQAGSSAHVRVVWFVAYLRCVFSNLRDSLEKRSGKTGASTSLTLSFAATAFAGKGKGPDKNEYAHEPLRKALQDMPSAFLEKPPPPSTDLLPPTSVLHGLPEHTSSDAVAIQKRRRSVQGTSSNGMQNMLLEPGINSRSASKEAPRGEIGSGDSSVVRRNSRKMSRKLSKQCIGLRDDNGLSAQKAPKSQQTQPDALRGPPCVVDGSCKICKGAAEQGQWGHPCCHGCSIVDQLPFNDHLFKKLLVPESETNLKPMLAEPPLRSRRHALTPPPMGMSNELRKNTAAPSASPRSLLPPNLFGTGGRRASAGL